MEAAGVGRERGPGSLARCGAPGSAPGRQSRSAEDSAAPRAASRLPPRSRGGRERVGGGRGAGRGPPGGRAALTSPGARFGLERFKTGACERRCCSAPSRPPAAAALTAPAAAAARAAPGPRAAAGTRQGPGALLLGGPAPPAPAEPQKPAEPRLARHGLQPGRPSRPAARAPWTPPRSAFSCPCRSCCSWRPGAARPGPARCCGGAPRTVSASRTAGCCSGWTAQTWGFRSCPPTSVSSLPTCKCAPALLREASRGREAGGPSPRLWGSSAPACCGGGGLGCQGRLGQACLGPWETHVSCGSAPTLSGPCRETAAPSATLGKALVRCSFAVHI